MYTFKLAFIKQKDAIDEKALDNYNAVMEMEEVIEMVYINEVLRYNDFIDSLWEQEPGDAAYLKIC